MKKWIFILGAIAIVSCAKEAEQTENQEDAKAHLRYDLALKDKLDDFQRIQTVNASNQAQVELGYHLYYDTRLSKTGNNSCNSCHNLSTYGVDNKPTSAGDAGMNGDRNSPTVLNASLHTAQFWDGRAKDVEEQAGMPILNPVEMAIPNEKFLESRLSEIPFYQEKFKSAYPKDNNPINYTNLRNAIAAFERQLVTPSRFDDYLAGKTDALTLDEKKGLMTFVSVGCNTCHNGALLGGNNFKKFGVFADYWSFTGSKKVDKGMGDLKKDSLLNYHFKVPSLRNISETGPYFHDGSVADLKKSVIIMAKTQLNYDLSSEEADKIVAFLKALKGDIPNQYKTKPSALAAL